MRSLKEISGMPRMSAAFNGWEKQITLSVCRQQVINALVSDILASVNFKGTIQPLNPRALSLKPEGQRAFTWLQIHCRAISIIPPIAPLTWDSAYATWDGGQSWDGGISPALPKIWNQLNVNDKIFYNNQPFKIMARNDYSLNGFMEYHAIQDYS